MMTSDLSRRSFLLRGAAAAGTVAFGATLLGRRPAAAAAPIVHGNSALEVTIDGDTGAVLNLRNKLAGISLCTGSNPAHPWRLRAVDVAGDVPGDPGWLDGSTGVTFGTPTIVGDTLTLSWTRAGYAVTATWTAPAGNADLRVRVQVTGTGQVSLVEYPSFGGVTSLSGGANRLAHPVGGGFVFDDPMTLFTAGNLDTMGIPFGPYPDGFNGPGMQWMAYFAEGGGGFYLGTEDAGDNPKWFDFFKVAEAAPPTPAQLFARIRHASPDVHAGNGFSMAYDVVIGAMTASSWYAAAERYRTWASAQPWTARGRLTDRGDDRCSWLLEETGYATFGIDARYDRSTWIDDLHATIGSARAFHVLSDNWRQWGSGYTAQFANGRDGFFPSRLNPDTLAAIHAASDRCASFAFPLLLNRNVDGPDRADADDAYQVLPRDPVQPDVQSQPIMLSRDDYDFPWLCPVPPLAGEIERYRIEGASSGPLAFDAAYYDIAASNAYKLCLDTGHGHKVGGGPELMSAHRALLAEAKAVGSAARGQYVPQGTEVVIENLVAELDFFQARALAAPAAGFETQAFRDWIVNGRCHAVPAFDYVYHEYGPVRLDGWGSLAEDAKQGDLFYWIAARVALAGGIYELDWEFGSMFTNSDGEDDDAALTTNPLFITRSHDIDPLKAAFVADLAEARTSAAFARKYLAYGRMQAPIEPVAPTIGLTWFFSNYFPTAVGTYQSGGIHTVPSVVSGAFTHHTTAGAAPSSLGLLYVNLQPSGTQTVTVPMNPSAYGLGGAGTIAVTEITATGATSRTPITRNASTNVSITLPSRRALLLEIGP